MAEWFKAAVLKTVVRKYRGFESYSLRHFLTVDRLDELTKNLKICPKIVYTSFQCQAVAEGVGFEPTELSFNGFQDRRLKPLGHPS